MLNYHIKHSPSPYETAVNFRGADSPMTFIVYPVSLIHNNK